MRRIAAASRPTSASVVRGLMKHARIAYAPPIRVLDGTSLHPWKAAGAAATIAFHATGYGASVGGPTNARLLPACLRHSRPPSA